MFDELKEKINEGLYDEYFSKIYVDRKYPWEGEVNFNILNEVDAKNSIKSLNAIIADYNSFKMSHRAYIKNTLNQQKIFDEILERAKDHYFNDLDLLEENGFINTCHNHIKNSWVNNCIMNQFEGELADQNNIYKTRRMFLNLLDFYDYWFNFLVLVDNEHKW